MPVNPPSSDSAGASTTTVNEGEATAVVVVPPGDTGSPVKSVAMAARGKRNEFMMKPIRNQQSNLPMSSRGCATDALNGGAGGVVGGDCSQLNNGCGDMDSGFSGSSSGASYVGSLRYQKSQCCSGGVNSLMARGQRMYEEPGLSSFSTRSSSSYGSSKSSHNLQRIMRSAEDPGPSSAYHQHAAMALNGMPGTSATLKPMSKNASFWSRKGWKIIPGLTTLQGGPKASSPVTASVLGA